MITLSIWCILNGFLFHFDPDIMTDNLYSKWFKFLYNTMEEIDMKKLTKEEFKAANNNIMTVMENHIIMLARCDRTTANLIANEILDLERELKILKDNSVSKEAFEKMKSKAYKKGHRQGYAKAIDDVLKLPKYKFYDTSKEFMNIRIDAISIEDILKLKEKTNE